MGAPAISPETFSTFGDLLKYLRKREELTQRELAILVGYSDSEVSRIEKNQSVPDAATLKALFVPALHLEHEPQWVERLLELAKQARLGELPETGTKLTPNNLPASLTTFIGREKEQAEILRLIGTHRLVTLTGAGGVGKTRISLKVGGQVLDQYANGVWLAELAPLSDPELLPQTVASALGIVTQSTSSHTESLIDFLRSKTALLNLDNCEHLLNASAHLADTLLKHCPHLKILATSREVLGITGEAIYRVPSLGLPHLQQKLENFREFESMRLFEERAQLVQTDFSLTMENASSVAQICSRLDGIPLAIELAAGKVSTFSTKQIAEQLDKSFNLLTGGSRTALPRQQTLRASIDWSWGLLTQPEQIIVRQLSVFAGGWTLESAQTVCDGDVLELTPALVRKSLIGVKQEAERETRYQFHEVIRQYAREQLIKSGEEENIRTRHLKYFLHLSERAEPALRGPRQVEWTIRINKERDNIRASLEWADQTDVEAGLYVAARLQRFWAGFNLREGSTWLSRFLQKHESHTHPRARAKALYMHGLLLFRLQEFDAALSAAKECLDVSRALGDKEGEIDGLLLLAHQRAMGQQPDIAINEELLQQAIALARSLGDIWREADALHGLAWSCGGGEKFAYWEEKAITLFRQAGDWSRLADSLKGLANFMMLNGDFDLAHKRLDEATLLSDQLNDKVVKSGVLNVKGRMAMIRGEYNLAQLYLRGQLEIAKEMGDRIDSLWCRAQLGYLALQEGNITKARNIFAEIAQEFQKDEHATGVVFSLEGMAGLYVAIDRPDIAARLIGWADRTRREMSETRARLEQADVDKIIAACLAKMGEVAFTDAYDDGQKMKLDEAVAYSFQVKP